MSPNGLVLLGDIGRPQGLKGETRLRSFTQVPEAIADYGPLQNETGAICIEIDALRSDGKGLVARLKGVTTREQAESLTGTKLYVPRDRLPEPAGEEWYHADLIGLNVVDEAGAAFGRVAAIHNFGAGDIIEIAPHAGGETLLLPFTDEAVPEVDMESGFIRIAPPKDSTE